jgi:hypothetical protein
MGQGTLRKLGKGTTLGGLLAGLLLLPLPVFAYTISSWTFSSHGINASNPGGDTKSIQEVIPVAGAGSNASNVGTSTITGSSETANVIGNLAGLTIISGDLKIAVTVGSTTQTTVLTGTLSNNIPLGAFSVNGSQSLSVNFAFENATFSYNSSQATSSTIAFR